MTPNEVIKACEEWLEQNQDGDIKNAEHVAFAEGNQIDIGNLFVKFIIDKPT